MKRWSILIALAAGTTSALLCWKVLGLIPHVPDEVSYVFQGKIFAAAKLWLSPPSVPEAFVVEHIVMTSDRWCSIYPPGWPFLLAMGWLFHAPWLVNPVLLALSVIGVWKLGSILYDDRTGILGAIFFVVSPFVLLMGAGFMAHVAELCCIIWCFVLIAKNGDRRTSFLAGLLGGFAFLIRPYTAIPLLLPALIWQPGLEKRKRAQALIAFSSGFLPFLLLFLVYNQLVFGGPFRTGYDLDPFWPSTHFSVREFLKNLSWYVETSSKYLWGWPFPDLLIFLPLLRPRIQWQKDLMLAACCMSLLGAYCFFSYHDIVYAGPRFLFEMMGFLSLLVVRSILSIYDLVCNYRIATVALKVIVLFLIVFPLMIRLPYQIQYHSQIYHGQTHRVIRMVENSGVGKNALVLISGNPYIFRSFFFQNALIPSSGGRVFVHDKPQLRGEILEAYPRNETWRIEIKLERLPGPNSYSDHFILEEFGSERLR